MMGSMHKSDTYNPCGKDARKSEFGEKRILDNGMKNPDPPLVITIAVMAGPHHSLTIIIAAASVMPLRDSIAQPETAESLELDVAMLHLKQNSPRPDANALPFGEDDGAVGTLSRPPCPLRPLPRVRDRCREAARHGHVLVTIFTSAA